MSTAGCRAPAMAGDAIAPAAQSEGITNGLSEYSSRARTDELLQRFFVYDCVCPAFRSRVFRTFALMAVGYTQRIP